MHRKDSRASRWIARSVLAAFFVTTPGLDLYRAAAANVEAKLQLVSPQAVPATAALNPAAFSALPSAIIPQATIAAPEIPAAEAALAAAPASPMQAAVSAAAMPSLNRQDAAPAQVSAEASSLFDRTAMSAKMEGGTGGEGLGGGAPEQTEKDQHLLGAITSARRPGEMLDAAQAAELGAKLGMNPEQTSKAVGRLAAKGRFVTFSNGRSLVVDLPPADPEEQPSVEGRALAMKAVALLNGGSTVDHLKAIALLRRAHMKFPQGDEDPAAVESRRQISYIRMNAALEVVRGALKEAERTRAEGSAAYRELVADARKYFEAAYYDSRQVPFPAEKIITEVAADAVSNFSLDAHKSRADIKELEFGLAASKLVAQQPAPKAAVAPAAARLESGEPETRPARLLPAPKTSTQSDAPARAPIIALNGVWFPDASKGVTLTIEGKESIAALTKAGSIGYMIAATFAEGQGTKERHHPVGTLVRVYNLRVVDGKMTAQFDVVREAAITSYDKDKEGTLFASVSYPKTKTGDLERMEGLGRAAREILSEFGGIHDGIKPHAINRAMQESRPDVLANVLAQDLPFALKVKQALLSASSLEERLETAVMELMGLVRGQWNSKGPDGKKSGADETKPLETMEDLQARMDAIGMPEEVRKVAIKEFTRLLEMNPKDSEAQKTRAYVDWLVEVPWAKRTEDHYDLTSARTILDRDHSGMDTVKERVLEFLAVRKKTGSKKGSIICFSGPPGVGKTSIASGIAEALGRKFVRLSLGGVHDETELRGHGRTYLGSLPGSVIKQMKVAGTVNPVMLLDEVDKIGRDGNHGDPTAALLEILDPAQNNTFRDHYMEVPYDLSQVLFIVTANELGNIPAPLRDRMEIIEFSGYTPQEKIAIAQKHVLPEKSKANGLEPGQVQLTDGAIRKVIEGYTREAGVRGLREKIESLLRKISAWSETRGEPIPATVDAKDVPKYLGIERFSLRETAENEVGLATGLAVNDFGGSTLNVEVLAVPGNGQLRIRKQMMKMTDDSALNVYAYIKSKAKELGIAQETFAKNDIEIAFTPAGDIDGPSAGVTMATAMASRLTGRKVLPGVAMTGEITLTGRVLPIGGLKQKVMAAHRMGYKLVLFPIANSKDLEGIPQEVRGGIKLVAVKSIDEVFALALEPAVPSAAVSAPAKSGFVWYKPWTWFSSSR